MPRKSRLPERDEELGKKNDDFRPNKKFRMKESTSRSWRGPRRTRIVAGIIVTWLLYIFWAHIPTDVPSVGDRGDPRFRPLRPKQPLKATPKGSIEDGKPTGPPPKGEGEGAGGDTQQFYEGPIRFFDLAETLSEGSEYRGTSPVVFTASNAKSVSHLAPLACDMAAQKINNVHLMLVGRDEISLDALKQINNIDEAACPVLWHDGRPDYGKWSTDVRMEVAAKAALGHFNSFLSPKAVIVDATSRENYWFLKAMKAKTTDIGLGLVDLPPNAAMSMDWLSRLDAAALQSWNDVDIEILVHAPKGSSGSLIRLLKSLLMADYSGGTYPRLTIELPNIVDIPTSNYLREFKWPPKLVRQPSWESKLTVRHRLFNKHDSPDEASIRFVESFYPSNPRHSHVLVLSSSAELSGSYYHYLKFLILKYKNDYPDNQRVLGISLEMPETLLDGKTKLDIPKSTLPIAAEDGTPPISLWQAPNSNAALYFGDKWKEFHSFLTHRLQRRGIAAGRSTTTKLLERKLVSESYPAWLEYLLELSRARSYCMIYPSFTRATDYGIATIHKELYQPPEEFLISANSQDQLTDDDVLQPPSISSTLTAPFNAFAVSLEEKPLHESTWLLSIFNIIPYSSSASKSSLPQKIPFLPELSLQTYDGQAVTVQRASEIASDYRLKFAERPDQGGCAVDKEKGNGKMEPGEFVLGEASDLFCVDQQASEGGGRAIKQRVGVEEGEVEEDINP